MAVIAANGFFYEPRSEWIARCNLDMDVYACLCMVVLYSSTVQYSAVLYIVKDVRGFRYDG